MEQQEEPKNATNTAPPIRIAIVDDHPAVLEGMTNRLDSLPGHRVVLSAASGERFLSALPALGPVDIAIVDLQMPVVDGWTVLERLREHHPSIRSMAFSFSKEPEWVRRAVAAGARAYVLKESRLAIWQRLVKEVMSTGNAFSEWVRECLAASPEPVRAGWIDRSKLPRREQEFLAHLLRPGNPTYGEIAALMGVGRSTVDGYMRYFNRHFDIHSREELVRRALLPVPKSGTSVDGVFMPTQRDGSLSS